MTTFKHLFALFIFSSLSSLVFVTESQAATKAAASCSYADVSSAISSVALGDTVTVPAGTCTWSSTLNINKGISLIGAGVGNTVIKSSASGFLIIYKPANPSLNPLMRISGMTIDLGGGARSAIGLYPGYTKSNFPSSVIQTKVRVDHNRFQNIAQGSTQIMFINFGGVRGVIDNNYFTQALMTFRANDPTMFDAGTAFWNSWEGVVFGKPDNNLYFENNTIYNAGQVTDCISGGRYAFRYNTIYTTNGQMFDLHGNNGTGTYACFGGEFYGNNIIGGSSGQFLDQRGGRVFGFNNNFSGTGWNFNVREEQDDSQSPLGTYTGPGTRYPQHVNGTYNWGNRANLTGSLIPTVKGSNCIGSACFNTPMPVAGQDFFTDSTSPKVSCGTLANRPASCTANQGYWATSQSCTNLTGMVGANPSTPISGTLYRCTSANTWDSGASPLQYPHPLIGGAASGGSSTLLPPFLLVPVAQ